MRRPLPLLRSIGLVAGLALGALGQDRPDLVVADFERPTYAPWVAEGQAFGLGPAPGALPGQMGVSGFEGKGLVNSFLGGDDATGVLTSPPIRIERPSLNFLIGGGKFPGETCLDLLAGGSGRPDRHRSQRQVRAVPKGSTGCLLGSWPTSLESPWSFGWSIIVKGGWGHHQRRPDRPVRPSSGGRADGTRDRVVVADRPVISVLPVAEKAPIRRVKVEVDGQVAREFDIKLADGPADFSTFLDLAPFQVEDASGSRTDVARRLEGAGGGSTRPTRSTDPASSIARKAPALSSTSRVAEGGSTTPTAWSFSRASTTCSISTTRMDGTGATCTGGTRSAPTSSAGQNLPIALYPHEYGDWAFSGSAVVDRQNTSGFGHDRKAPPLVAAYTSTGRGECIVLQPRPGPDLVRTRRATRSSSTRGETPGSSGTRRRSRWVMAVYDEEGGGPGRRVPLLARPQDLDLREQDRRLLSSAPTSSSCPSKASPGRKLLGSLRGRRPPISWASSTARPSRQNRAASTGPGSATFTPPRPSATSPRGDESRSAGRKGSHSRGCRSTSR